MNEARPLLPRDLDAYCHADRNDLLAVVEGAARTKARLDARVARWVAECIVGHWCSLGFVFLRDGTASPAVPPLSDAQSATTDLMGMRRATHLELIDAADYAAEVTAGLSRSGAGLAVHNIMTEMYGFTVLRDTRVKTEGPTTLSELLAAEAEAQERERKKWPGREAW